LQISFDSVIMDLSILGGIYMYYKPVEQQYQELLSFAKVVKYLFYLPHILTMCIVFWCLPWWVALIFIVIYVFFEKYLSDIADIAGVIIGIVCGAPVVLTVLLAISWSSLFAACFVIKYRLKKIIMKVSEEIEAETARRNLDRE